MKVNDYLTVEILSINEINKESSNYIDLQVNSSENSVLD